jgi:PAS domain S-box-containing protein
MAAHFATPARRALNAARTVSLLTIVGSLIALLAWQATSKAGILTRWQFLMSAGAGLLGVALTWYFRQMPVLASALVAFLCACVVLVADSVTNVEVARSRLRFEPFLASKILAFGMAIIAPAPIALGYLIIALCGLIPIFDYFALIPEPLKSHFAAPEPWTSAILAFFAFFVLAHRIRERKYEREILLQTMVEDSEEGVWVVDRDRKTTYVNPALSERLGYSPGEMTGKDALTFMDEDSRALALKKMSRGERGIREQYELRLIKRDQTVLWTQMAANPIFDDHGRFVGAFAFVTDISSRKALEERLSESEAFLRTIIGNLPIVLLAFDRSGRFTVYDGLALKTIGKKPGERLGETIDHAWGKSAPIWVESFDRALAGESNSSSAEMWGRFWEIRWSPLFNGKGQTITGVVAVAIDETERHAFMQEMDSRRELLQGVLDNMSEGVFAVSPDGMIRIANKVGLRFIGLQSEEQLPFSMKDAPTKLAIRDLEGNPLPPESLTVSRALKGERTKPLTSVMRIPGTREDLITQSSASPFTDPSGKGTSAVVVLTDVTETLNLDRMKDQFIRVSAHELKTPVSSVKLNSQLLPLLLPSLDARQKTVLANLIQGADRIDRITRDLLDLSQLQVGRFWLSKTHFDLCQMAEAVAKNRQRLTTRHQIHVERPGLPLIISADYERIEQVVDNLLDNAVKYSPEGGEISVQLGLESAPEGRSATFRVCDHGIGIASEKQKHIFERFFRAHTDTPHDYGGIGVGLYLSKEFIARHGGRIGFESVENKGSCFHFSIPVEKEGTA